MSLSNRLPRGFVLFATIVAASCGADPATQPSATPVPLSTPTRVSPSPTLATGLSPTIAPSTPTKASGAQITFEWAHGAVCPADADDVQAINTKVMAEKGILGASGNETRMIVFYDPALITVAQIEEIFRQLGHPVVEPDSMGH